MTEPAPERAAAALKTIGMEERPVATLEREDALFVLTEGTLLYQDGAGTRRVTLRDLTRIHSDQEGLLRVETPAGTALTASLLGFEPSQVQGFFAQVRDATARVKQLPSSPLPAAVPATKTFASVPATLAPRPASSGQPASTPASPPLTSLAPEPDRGPPPRPREDVTPVVSEASIRTTPVTPAPITPAAGTPAPGMPAPTTPAPAVVSGPTPAADPARRTERVVITSSGFSPAARRPETTAESRPEPQLDEVQQRPAFTEPAAGATLATEPLPSSGMTETTTASVVKTGVPIPHLSAQAEVVAALAGRLRFLGVVLFVGAVLLAIFQFVGGQRLEGLWTLLAGGVGTVTLTVLSEAARLLAAMAVHLGQTTHGHQSAGPEGRPLDVR